MKKLLYIVAILLISACKNPDNQKETVNSGLKESLPAIEEEKKVEEKPSEEKNEESSAQKEQKSATKSIHFSDFNKVYRFSAQIPENWQVEYVPEILSINIFDPEYRAENTFPSEKSDETKKISNLEKSQIFLRFFDANSFLTLSTVTIHQQTENRIGNHQAKIYDIEKKPSAADFPHQPSWRNQRHIVTDIRFSENSPSVFYVIAENPQLDKKIYQQFLDSLIFDNDLNSFQPPIDKATSRITKKPFGLKVTPENSPVQPERFSGYHTGTDFETFPEEIEVQISAFCGGPLLEKRHIDGYGGVAVQSCIIENQPVMVLYGHLRLSDIIPEKGAYLKPGAAIGLLGAGYSPETDFERRHLHLAIHKGAAMEYRGYVESESELKNWLDPAEYF